MAQLHHDARLLAGVVSGQQILCPGPGHGKADRSLCLKPSPSAAIGYIFKSFAGDDHIACLDHIRACVGLPAFAAGATKEPQRTPRAIVEPPDNTCAAKKIWIESTSIRGSLAAEYLLSRGLRLATDIDWHRVLRFHKSCVLDGYQFPAMIALMRDILTDEPVAIQRTFLAEGGTKVERRMLGPAKGAAIKIDQLGTSTNLCIGEGLESCLSGRAMGFFPAWCVGSAGAISSFPVVPGVRQLRIFAEADETNKGATRECAGRWQDAGREVFATRPSYGKDLNDELRNFEKLLFDDRAKDFLETCQRFWPGAAIARKAHDHAGR